MKRTNYCGALNKNDIGREVILNGWVHKLRDLGNICFVEIRDREGYVQVVFNPQINKEAFNLAKELKNEYVVEIEGTVIERTPETINPNIKTGEIEVIAKNLKILNRAKPLPFSIQDDSLPSDIIRLKYRYLDLRRNKMFKNLKLRNDITFAIRKFLIQEGFLEVETPILTKSTPEGARDYLVPSRVNRGKFFALPQSPQLFKQSLMIAGIDKYFQIAKCFRDEDLRADRQPEFTQIDIEMSFVQENDIFYLVENLLKIIFETANYDISIPFERLTYNEAMENYGIDKPDLRFNCKLINLTEELGSSDFKLFKEVKEKGGAIIGLNAKECSKYSRKEIDEIEQYVRKLGAGGLISVKKENGQIKSFVSKYVLEAIWNKVFDKANFNQNDLLFIVAGDKNLTYEIMGQLRLFLANKEKWIEEDKLVFLWVTDFPLFEYSEEEKRWVSKHHPFTSPKMEDLEYLESEPWRIHARAYDIVLNGIELGGGSIRIHNPELQQRIFKILGLSDCEIEKKFGFFIEALQYGAPPHGGIALGLDRIIMILAKESNIREVIPFPKTSSAQCLFTQSPSEVSSAQLKELGISIINEEK